MKQIHIGEIIKQRRLELKLTQEELCEGICEPPTMSRIEKGHQTPTHSKLKALLNRLNLPSEKYYALMSKNELEIEKLKNEIIDCNTRQLHKEGLAKIDELFSKLDEDDHVTHQFIQRSKALLGKLQNGDVVPYSAEEKLTLLFSAIHMTIPNFDIDEIGSHWYSLDELKIINQIAVVYSDNNQDRKAIDIYYQLMKHIKKHLTINFDNVSIAILIAYNYSRILCRKKQYEDAYEMAEWGMQYVIKWGRASHAGGLLYVLGESQYRLGNIEASKNYYIRSYYAFQIMGNPTDAEIMLQNIKEYYSIELY